MNWKSALAIYVLFWVMSAFVVLPFGVKTPDELGVEKTPGQVESAPANFRPKRVLIGTTMLATILFALFYGNYVYGWLRVDQLTVFKPA
jgi:predicted secreted protein